MTRDEWAVRLWAMYELDRDAAKNLADNLIKDGLIKVDPPAAPVKHKTRGREIVDEKLTKQGDNIKFSGKSYESAVVIQGFSLIPFVLLQTIIASWIDEELKAQESKIGNVVEAAVKELDDKHLEELQNLANRKTKERAEYVERIRTQQECRIVGIEHRHRNEVDGLRKQYVDEVVRSRKIAARLAKTTELINEADEQLHKYGDSRLQRDGTSTFCHCDKCVSARAISQKIKDLRQEELPQSPDAPK